MQQSQQHPVAKAELSVGPLSLTQPNPTQQLTDPTQPITEEKFRPTTQPNPQTDTTNNELQAQLR